MVQDNPSSNELLHMKKKIEDEIVKRFNGIKGVRKVNASLNITWKDRFYYISGDVMIETEKGLTNTDLTDKSVVDEVDNILKEYDLIKYQSGHFNEIAVHYH